MQGQCLRQKGPGEGEVPSLRSDRKSMFTQNTHIYQNTATRNKLVVCTGTQLNQCVFRSGDLVVTYCRGNMQFCMDCRSPNLQSSQIPLAD